jgi:asparagine synthase (glutamine-hydrolysing)
MFAFVIYDIEKKKFFIARDRFGIKPLYYYLDKKGFYFSSEIKSFSVISSWKPKANIKTSLDFLVWSVLDHTEETLFDGVNQIKPGHYVNLYLDEDLNLNNNVISQRCWYNLEKKLHKKNNGKNYDEFFMHSLNEHLLSEVKIGSCLSGGLDSSSIVCNVAGKEKFKDKFNTVTAQCELKELDETKFAKEVINKYSLKGSFVMPSLEKLKNRLDEMIWHQDEPFISTSNLLQFEVFKKANENEIKVMLDGQGADESLAGYKGFIGSYGAYLIKKGRLISFVKFVISFYSHPQVSFKYIVFSTLGKLFPSIHSFLKSFTNEINLTNFLDKNYKKFLSKNPAIPVSSKNPFLDDLVNQIKKSSLPMLLHWEDRASMAHSIEARVPFLDHQLVEYSLNISEEFRFSKGHSKVALRNAQRGKVPESILDNLTKLGYVSAEEFWMIKKDSNYFRDLLEDALDSLKKIIKKDLLKEYDKFLSGKRPFSYLFWRVICYSLWLRKFKVSLV